MFLRHVHIPLPRPYTYSENLQSLLVKQFLHWKASVQPGSHPHNAPSPPPTLLTFQTEPTYTCGRREIGKLSDSQIAHLRADGKAAFHEALRGGQTTFHGPGQLTAYLIASLGEHGLNPRTYVRMLEDNVIETGAKYAIKSFTTSDPGVWTSADDKLASVGVHMRRNVTSHGVGINVTTDLGWFDRIVACGLEGKRATSFERLGVRGVTVDDVAGVLAETFAKNLDGVEEVVSQSADDVLQELTLDG
ncbi:hypothetical protein MMC25_001944 [Agyrium rufum]|nr:hypothetical protein [Agyrium rufum]